jgi:5-methyltetrahydropteroyltriglutamate--homocysteine methyltransferase
VTYELPKALRTTSVGSFPKPEYLQAARNKVTAGKMDEAELHKLERQATEEVIRLQEDLGIDVLVHGEMERGDMTTYFAEVIPGMGVSGLVRSYGNRYYRKPIIQGALKWPGPMTVDSWKAAQALTDRPMKGMLTGPYTMVDWSFDEHYANRREAILAMAEVIREEVKALQDAGAQFIQIDEPAVSTRPSELPLAIEAMDIVTRGITAHTLTHICYGDFAAVYDDLVRIPVQQIDLELANSEFDLLGLIGERGFGDKEIGLGVVDIHSHVIEDVDQVRTAIRRALEVLPPEKIYVDPDCGLKTRTWDEAKAKLEVMMQAVRDVRREIGIN